MSLSRSSRWGVIVLREWVIYAEYIQENRPVVMG